MNDVISMNEMLKDFQGMIDPETSKICSVWEKVVSRIKSYNDEESDITMGEKLAQNTHAVDLKKGVLLVEATHSGWIQYLRLYQKFIIKGLSMECPDLKIRSLAFRTRGSEVNLFDGYDDLVEKSRKEQNKVIEKTSKEVEEFYKNDKKNSSKNPKNNKNDMNPELKNEIADLYGAFEESMLTKDGE